MEAREILNHIVWDLEYTPWTNQMIQTMVATSNVTKTIQVEDHSQTMFTKRLCRTELAHYNLTRQMISSGGASLRSWHQLHYSFNIAHV